LTALRAVPTRLGSQVEFWQRRYWEHAIRDDADLERQDLERHVDYIHFNPVKHGHVPQVRDWPHSSFHRYVASGELPPDWGGDVRDAIGAFGE
jgi:putative transposase